MVKLRVLKKYKDIELGREILPQEIIEVSDTRAKSLLKKAEEIPYALGFTVLKIEKKTKKPKK